MPKKKKKTTKKRRKRRAVPVVPLYDDVAAMLDIVAEDHTRYLETGVSFLRRQIDVGDITVAAAHRFTKNLQALENLSDEPITINIHSQGGLCESGWWIHDAIMHSPLDNFTGYCWGICASMAVSILQACNERIISPNTMFMVHEGTDAKGDGVHARTTIAYGKEAENQLISFYVHMARRTGIPIDKLEKLISGADAYLSPEEALELNMVDKVLEFNKKFQSKPVDAKKLDKIIKERSFSEITKKIKDKI